MLLYKYRPLGDLSKIADILVNQRLYCANYFDLNDPFEGQFLTYRGMTGGDYVKPAGEYLEPWNEIQYDYLPPLKEQVLSVLGENPLRICSLSADPASMNLWSLYADSHRGVAVEIEAQDLAEIHQVIYHPDLPRISPDVFAATSLEPFLRKTLHWKYEEEYRILTSGQFYGVAGRITSIIIGCKFDGDLSVLRHLAGSIPIRRASLNHGGACIEVGMRNVIR